MADVSDEIIHEDSEHYYTAETKVLKEINKDFTNSVASNQNHEIATNNSDNKYNQYELKENINNPTIILRDNALLIIIVIFYVITLLLNQNEVFLEVTFTLALLLNFFKIIFLIKYKNIFFFLLKIILLTGFVYFLIKENNPFYHLFFFWLPCQNLFRAIFMIRLYSLVIFREYDIMNIENKIRVKKEYYTIDRNIFYQLFVSVKKTYTRFFFIFVILIFFKICYFFLDDNYGYLLINKNKLSGNKYFIAANLFNNENILDDWKNELVKLINYLGTDNCYVSIFENGDSTDRTPNILRDFAIELDTLGIKNQIVTEKYIQKGIYERIVFLSFLRNLAIEYIHHIPDLDFNKTKVIFFNDIIFKYTDIVKLIDTNEGDYDFACGMDFYESFYDTWVTVGIDGKYIGYYYPYFYNKVARNRLMNGENIRMFSCWNGVTIFNAEILENRKISFRYPTKIRQSECMLFIVDMWSLGKNKIILNPNVRVAYEYYYYYMNRYVYAWTKNLFTYFYYYFKFFSIPDNKNFANLWDNKIEVDRSWWNTYLYYLKND